MAKASRAAHDELMWGAAAGDKESHDEQALQLCRYYIAKDVSGVFFAPLEYIAGRNEINERILEEFERAGIPVVLLDRDIYSYPRRSLCDLVGIDNRRAGFTVADYLIKQGCGRIVFVAHSNSAPTVEQRILGFSEAARGAGLEPIAEIGDPRRRDWIAEVMERHNPDGCVCANDRTAGELMIRLNELGIEIPSAIKVIGIDDAKYAPLLSVPLTTLRQPCHAMGAAAVWTMIQRIEHPTMPARDILLDCQLIVRRSCGVPQVSKSTASSPSQVTDSGMRSAVVMKAQ